MNKIEFLNELRNGLEGKLPEPDIREITSDYGDIFDNNTADGKSEEETAAEIGSPAKVARTILEDEGVNRSKTADSNGGREYTDFQRNINEKTSKIFDKVIEPDWNVEIERLTPMSRRLGAYFIDGIFLGVIVIGGLVAILAPFMFYTRTSSFTTAVNGVPVDIDNGFMMEHMVNNGFTTIATFMNIMIIVLLFGAFNLLTTIFLWATNGYTPGKWILRMRVVKISGEKIGFLDAVLRELVIKCIANSLLSGFLNIGSFIWGCATEDHKTAHDLLVRTRVVERARA